MAAETADAVAALWPLDPGVDYLNHGSYGACPRAVLARQQELRDELEREPVDFLSRRLPALLAEARASIAPFVGADPEDLAFVPNATSAVSAVLRSLELREGDELLTTSHAYAACRKALEFAGRRSGARLVVAHVPFPVAGDEDLSAAGLAAVTPRTRLALLDLVTSPTALVWDLPQLIAELEGRGVAVLVDGAHALGMVPLALDRLGASWFTANAHKWLCAPKGSAILHVRRDRRSGLHPLAISHGYEEEGPERFRAEFDWTGTADPTPWLATPAALRFLDGLLPGGWPAVAAANRALALAARRLLCDALEIEPPAPESMIGAMASLPLPAPLAGSPAARLDAEELTTWFRGRGVEPWFTDWSCPGGKLVRVSAQVYNRIEQYERFARLLLQALGRGA